MSHEGSITFNASLSIPTAVVKEYFDGMIKLETTRNNIESRHQGSFMSTLGEILVHATKFYMNQEKTDIFRSPSVTKSVSTPKEEIPVSTPKTKLENTPGQEIPANTHRTKPVNTSETKPVDIPKEDTIKCKPQVYHDENNIININTCQTDISDVVKLISPMLCDILKVELGTTAADDKK